MFASGLTDAAYRSAKLAVDAEQRKDLEEAMQHHQEASDFYQKQADELLVMLLKMAKD